ncbi:hypothetical protein [Lacticigenium naphthae]|uniref:hypothetical protein n=1 Tax=Lacticigenium naphthae TaxID=515351 RepID=UPI000425EFEA|nr:hypothetical protein [Lacticigenium naphthae]
MWQAYYHKGNESIHINENKVMIQIEDRVQMRVFKQRELASLEAFMLRFSLEVLGK